MCLCLTGGLRRYRGPDHWGCLDTFSSPLTQSQGDPRNAPGVAAVSEVRPFDLRPNRTTVLLANRTVHKQ